MTVPEFRKRVKLEYPHIKISVRTVSFSGFGYDSAKFLTITGAHYTHETQTINAWAEEVGLMPDKSIFIPLS